MADLAQIGFAADTSGLDQALPALRALPPAAKAVETSAQNATAALSNVSAAAEGTTTATTATVRVLKAASAELSTQAANANKAADAYKKLESVQERINRITGANKDQFSNIGRAADIEAYGQSLDALRAKYDPLFAASRQYKAALGEINNALKVGALNEKQHAAAIMDTKVAFVQQVNSIRGVTQMEAAHVTATNKARAATAGFSWEAKNLSYQLVDVTQGLASGVPLFQIFAQQAGQIGQVLATAPKGGASLFKEIGNAILGFLTPLRLAIAGVIALGVAFVSAYGSWKTFTLGLIDTASIAQTTTKSMMQLQAAASFKGISADEFVSGIRSFSRSVYDARNNMGGLADVFAANNVRAKTFDDYLSKAADLIQRASNDQQRLVLLQQMGLPATMEWVRLLSGGAAGIDKAKKAAAAFAADDSLAASARRFDEAWNTAWTNFGLNARNAFQKALEFGATFFDRMDRLAKQVGNSSFWDNFLPADHLERAKQQGIEVLTDFQKRFGGDSANPSAGNTALGDAMRGQADKRTQKTAVDPNAARNAIALQQQQISLLGDLATVEQQVTLKQLELNAAALNHINVTKEQRDAILNAARAQAEMNRVNQQASIGIFNLRDAQKAAADTLQMWIDKGLVDKTNAEQMAAAHLVLARNIEATKNAALVAAAPLQQLKQLELDGSNLAKNLDQATTGALTGMVQPIQDMLNGVTSLSAGFKNLGVVVLQAIQQMIVKMLIITPIAKALQAVMGGMFGGGGIMSLFGSGGVPGAIGPTSLGGAPLAVNANGGVYNSPSLSAFSGQIVKEPTLFKYASGAGLMGEAGPEGILPLKRGPSGALGVQMFGRQGSNDNKAQSITYAPANTYNVGGSVTQDDLAKLKKTQDDDRRAFASNVVGVIANQRKHNVRV